MFTGIITATGKVKSLSDGRLIVIFPDCAASDVKVGDSVAINGVCLTAKDLSESASEVGFDLSEETLDRTTLGELNSGDSVNIEHPLAVGDRMGGHWLQGHVDAIGTLVEIKEQTGSVNIRISVNERFDDLIVEKGSIAIDGISLTPFNVTRGEFDVAIIPHTLAATTLQFREPGDKVNVEFDIVGKYIRKQLRKET